MKKLLILFFTTCAALWASAQTDNCKCEEVRTQHTVKRVICELKRIPGFTSSDPQAVVISLTYTEVRCGGRVRYQVDNVLISTSLFNHYPNPTASNPSQADYPCDPAFGTPPRSNIFSNTNDPSTQEEWFGYLQNAIAQLLPVGNSTGTVYQFSSGCMSLVTTAWPAGTIIYVEPSGDVGGTPVPVDISGQSSLVLLPCTTVECCVMEIVRGVPTYSTIAGNACESGSPDLSKLPKITSTDPSGNVSTYTAGIIGSSTCQSMCGRFAPASFIATDVSPINQELSINFSVTPTLVQDAINFTTKVDIDKVQVYDMQGKLLIDSPIENKQML
ncbi:MAG: hypothetical protein EAY81_02555, partial [Bacteroidetes bacterium]